MTPGVISFSCPSCSTRLTVPESMAGISGPCPRCSATIQAPEAPPKPTIAEPLPTVGSAPAPTTAPTQTPVQAPRKAPAAAPAPASEDPPKRTAIPSAKKPSAPSTSVLSPKRSTSDAQKAKGIDTKHSTADAERRRPQTASSRSSSRKPAPTMGRILLPSLFIAIGGTIVYLLCYYFLPGGPAQSLWRNTLPSPAIPPPQTSEANLPSLTNEQAKPSAIPTTPPTAADSAVPDAPPITVDGADAIQAEEVLSQFLAANSLAERIKLIDPPRPMSELEDTVLARPLPPVIGLTPETPNIDTIENLINFPFRVSFQGREGSIDSYTILVRKRSDFDPLVVIDPFLDLVDGRLARFAAEPVDGIQSFHAVIEAMPRAFEENIPDPDKKITYKLSACDVGNETARAYTSRYSSFAEELFTSDSKLRWGRRLRATVTLQWNKTEDPDQPYIELIEIKSLDWNP